MCIYTRDHPCAGGAGVTANAVPRMRGWVGDWVGGLAEQFINTGLLFLLVYGTAPLGYTTPALLQDFKIFTGAYNDFSREWQVLEEGFSIWRGQGAGRRGGGCVCACSVCAWPWSYDQRP